MAGGLGSDAVRQLLQESFREQFGVVTGDLIMDRPELFSAAHQLEMEEIAQPHLNAALRESYIDVIQGREPRES